MPAGGPRRADAAGRRRPARAAADRRALARGRRRARPARLLPAAAAEAKLRVAELVEAGDLIPVEVEGWGGPRATSRQPRGSRAASTARALIGPFDSLIWERRRVERIFGF